MPMRPAGTRLFFEIREPGAEKPKISVNESFWFFFQKEPLPAN
jgi:hypothetical protein